MKTASVLLALVILLAFGVVAQPAGVAGSTVKVFTQKGHGSGVHIGHGLVLTAAHVTTSGFADVLDDRGARRKGEVLWQNPAYDVALIKLDDELGLAVSGMSCTDPAEGAKVRLRGSPYNIEFLTSEGVVAGKARPYAPWKTALVVNAAVLPGMSGGPLFDAFGRLVGLNVGVVVAPMGTAAAPTGFGFAVPASVLCDLMGRTS